MSTLLNLFSPEFTEALGWTILHSLWQGIAVFIVLSLLIVLLRKNSAQVKYLISFLSLLIIVGWAVNTFVHSYKYALEKRQLRSEMLRNPNFIKEVLAGETVASANNETVKASEMNKHELRKLKLRSFFQRHFNVIVAFWLIGMLLFAARMISGFLFTQRLRRFRLKAVENEIIEKMEQFARKLNLARKIKVCCSPLIDTPITFGIVKPIILFPISAFTGLSAKDIEAILAHELAHIARHDYLSNIIQSVIETVFFFHPAVWIISRQIRNERENSCDNMAVGLIGDKKAYIRSLAKAQISYTENRNLALAFASSKGGILQRIKRLQNPINLETNLTEKLIAIFVVAVGLAMASFTVSERPFPKQNNNEITVADTVFSPDSISISIDSLKQKINAQVAKGAINKQSLEKLEKVVEVAMSENNNTVSGLMKKNIDLALTEMNIGEVFKTASEVFKSVGQNMVSKESPAGFLNGDIYNEMGAARKELQRAKDEMRNSMKAAGLNPDSTSNQILNLPMEMVGVGLDMASSALENFPFKEMIGMALTGSGNAGSIISGSQNQDYMKPLGKEDVEHLKGQMKEKEKELEAQRQKLKKLKRELKKANDKPNS